MRSPFATLDAKPVDHWFGFVVATGAFMSQAAIWGVRSTISTLARPINDDSRWCSEPPCTDSHVTATAAGIAMGLGPVFGILAGGLTAKLGGSTLVMLSAVLVAASLLLSTLARTPAEFIVAYAPLMGVGSGFMVTPGAVAAGTRFDKYVGIGMGIVYAGGGFGSAVLPRIAGAMLDSFGPEEWRRVQNYLAISCVFGFVAGIFVRARKWGATEDDGALEPSQHTVQSVDDTTLLDAKPSAAEAEAPPPLLKDLLLSKRYALSALTAVCYGWHYYASMYYVVPFARAQGVPGGPYADNPVIDIPRATSLMLIFGLSQGAGSLGLGVISTRVDLYKLFLVCCVGSAAVNFATPWVTSFDGLAVLAAALGVLSAGARLCFPSMVAQMFSGPALGAMMGITLAGYGVGALPAPPISSVIIAANGGRYTAALSLMGGLVLCSGLLGFFGMQRYVPKPVVELDDDDAPAVLSDN